MIQFANPGFLWALPLLGVPVVLHLMQRQMPRRLVFPTIRFIKKANDSQHGRNRLKDILTLLSRLLILAALILFFAGPRRVKHVEPGSDQTGARVVFLLDTSASMQATDYIQAVEDAIDEAVADYPTARFTAVISSDRIAGEVPWTSAEALKRQVKAWKPGLLKGNHEPALARVMERIGTAGDTVCIVVSDFQTTDWNTQQLDDLSGRCRLVLKQLPTALTDNVTIVGASYNHFQRNDKRILLVTARIKNHAVTGKSIALRLQQGADQEESTVNLSGGEQKKVRLEVPADLSHQARLTVAESDGYPVDNTYLLWTGPAPPIPVALLSSDRPTAGLERYFLVNALSLEQTGRPPIMLFPDGNDRVSTDRLEDIAVLISLDSAPADISAVKKWVEKGGRMVYFAGPNALNNVSDFNAGGVLRSRPLTIHGDRAGLEAVYIDSIDTSDPLLKPFASAKADLNQFPIFRYLGLDMHASADSLIKLQNQQTLLLRERLGLGEVYVCAIGMLPGWSEFPTSRSFVPVIRQLVEAGVAEDRSGAYRLWCGDPVPQALLDKGASPDVTAEAGITSIADDVVVVNVNRAESAPDVLNTAAVSPTDQENGDATLASTTAGLVVDKDLSIYLVGLILFGVLCELVAANYHKSSRRG